jgi:hypothetical protein
MKCETPYFQGLSDVICKLGKIKGIMLTNKGTTFTDVTLTSISTHHTGIASVTTASRNSMVFPVLSFENTTDDVNIETSGLGYKDTFGKPIPSALVYLDVSACDYQTLSSLEGRLYDVLLYTDEGKQMATKKSLNVNKGFRAKVAFKYGLPPSDNGQLQFAMHLFFRNPEEFMNNNVVYSSPSYTFGDLVDFVPVGLNLEITTAYVPGTFTTVYKVTKRSTGLGMTGLAAADFEILESDGTPAPVTVTSIVDNGLGSYNVLIKNATPAALSSGQYYRMQVSDDDATYVTYLSNVIKETVA